MMNDADVLRMKKLIEKNEEEVRRLRCENIHLENELETRVLFLSGIDENKLLKWGGMHPSGKKYDNGEKVYKHHQCKIVVEGKKESKLERYEEIGKVLPLLNKHHGKEFAWLDLVNENCKYSQSSNQTTFTFSVYYLRSIGCCKYASPPNNWEFPEVPIIDKSSNFREGKTVNLKELENQYLHAPNKAEEMRIGDELGLTNLGEVADSLGKILRDKTHPGYHYLNEMIHKVNQRGWSLESKINPNGLWWIDSLDYMNDKGYL